MIKPQKILCLFLLALLFASPIVEAQQTPRTIVGKVIDKDTGDPLNGVSVSSNDRSVGASTDVDGQYSVRITSERPDFSLIFSYLGYEIQEVVVGKQSVLNVELQNTPNYLDEAVVVGYGVQKRRDVTGAVLSVRPDDINSAPRANIAQLLQGRLPGLNVTNTGSSAEGSLTVRVRARNSINADASPLIVLDGIQYSGFLSEINPSDIESMEILKDASSAAIYGARAANGVILITTKKGSEGTSRISFDSNVGFSEIARYPDVMTGEEFYNFKLLRAGFTSAFEQEHYAQGISTNWLDHASQTGVRQEYNLSVSGGTANTSYFVSGNAALLNGIAINDVYDRYTVRVNLETKITPWLSFGTNTSLGHYTRPGAGADIGAAIRMNPLTLPYDDNGNLALFPHPDEPNMASPLEPLNHQRSDLARSVVTTNFLHVDLPFIEGLSYRIIGGYNFRTRLIDNYRSSANTIQGIQQGGWANTQNQYRTDWSIENILNYQRSFGAHSINLTGVYTAGEITRTHHNLTGVGFPSDSRTNYQYRDASALTATDEYEQTNSLSQMFRANYTYDGKYLLTATVRRDGFSAFGANNKYGIFPSVAVGWNMDAEPFFESLTFIDRSKLRFSYGENGNQAIGAYASSAELTQQYYLDEAGNTLVGFYPTTLADPTLSWETTRQLNAGWDYSFLNGRLFGSVDYYYANTFDLLLNKSIPQINGAQTIRQNIGRTKSSGIEIGLSSVNVSKQNFTWTTDFNISHTQNSIVDVGLFDEHGNALDNLGSRWFIGQPIRVLFDFRSAGIWQQGDDILGSSQPDARVGDMRVVDYNGDGKIDVDDRHILGQTDPTVLAGLTNTLTYKNFTFSFFFNASFGNVRQTGVTGSFFERDNKWNLQWWTPENTDTFLPENREGSNPHNANFFGRINNVSFIRLNDVYLGYRVPEAVLKRIGFARLEVFGNVQNLWTITNYIGLDPEFSTDWQTPLARTFIAGLKLSL